MFEVELKFPVPSPARFLEEMRAREVVWTKRVCEVDTYFQHPSRDFARTDEALRIRRHVVTSAGSEVSETLVTYKGAKIGSGAKTRKEIELPLTVPEKTLQPFEGRLEPALDTSAEFQISGQPEAEPWFEFFEALGFRRSYDVRKVRFKAWFSWQGRTVEISYDIVNPIGTYVELELLSPDWDGIDAAQRAIRELADEFGLADPEMRSYLELVQSKAVPQCHPDSK